MAHAPQTFPGVGARPRLEIFVGLVYQGKNIVLRFIREYSSLRYFGLLGNKSIFIWRFLKDDILACVETWD